VDQAAPAIVILVVLGIVIPVVGIMLIPVAAIAAVGRAIVVPRMVSMLE
jgi:hypothetical protein